MLKSLILCSIIGLATQVLAADAGGPCYDRTPCQQIGPDPSPASAYYNRKCVPDTTSVIGQIGWQQCTKKVDPAEGTGFFPISYPLGTPNEAIPSTTKCGDTYLWNAHPIGHAPYWQVKKYFDATTQQWLPLPCGYYYEAKSCTNS